MLNLPCTPTKYHLCLFISVIIHLSQNTNPITIFVRFFKFLFKPQLDFKMTPYRKNMFCIHFLILKVPRNLVKGLLKLLTPLLCTVLLEHCTDTCLILWYATELSFLLIVDSGIETFLPTFSQSRTQHDSLSM